MILDRIVAHKQKEVAAKQQQLPIEQLKARCRSLPDTRGFIQRLGASDDISLIAEVKRASPSKGVIREDFHPVEIAQVYESAGASAISVLTDEHFFQGHLDYLSQIHQAVALPLLRKDFVIDPYQIYEARVAGADAILLIAACLEVSQLSNFLALAHNLELDALVEVHSAAELDVALGTEAQLIGINNRNLHTFETTLDTTFGLLPSIPEGRTVVSESGIHERADVLKLQQHGVDAILVGESLMRSADIATKLHGLLGT